MAQVGESSAQNHLADEKQEELFDAFANDYDLLLDDWRHNLEEQGRVLDKFFREYAQTPVETVFDCTCGIGTQCIGLAKLGYSVKGMDISGKSILRAREEAAKAGLDIEFDRGDIRKLDSLVAAKFDAVISCDNSLPALLSEEDLNIGLKNIYNLLETSGVCIASIRNYDRMFAERKRFNPRQIHEIDGKRIIVFDVWDYAEDEFVVFNIFFLQERESGWDVSSRRMVYRAVYRNEMISALKQTGFGEVVVVDSLDGKPLDFDYYISIHN